MSYIFDCEYPDTNSVWMLNVQIRIWIIYLVSVALRLDGQSEISVPFTLVPRGQERNTIRVQAAIESDLSLSSLANTITFYFGCSRLLF
jgi:hypothetical protein